MQSKKTEGEKYEFYQTTPQSKPCGFASSPDKWSLEKLKGVYAPLICEADEEIRAVVKAADKISAYIKCVEELKAGNMEFRQAAEQCKKALEENPLPEVRHFMENFMPSFSLTLDELQ